jgi:hypothetical protein
MHEREWEMMYPSRLFRVDHLPVNDMIKSGFILQRDGRWYVDPERSATLNEFMQFLQIKDADNQPVQIRSDNNGFVRTHKTQQHPLPKKFRNKKRG